MSILKSDRRPASVIIMSNPAAEDPHAEDEIRKNNQNIKNNLPIKASDDPPALRESSEESPDELTADSIYGKYARYLPLIMDSFEKNLKAFDRSVKKESGHSLYNHLLCRIKEDNSMREKCVRKGLPVSSKSALSDIHDAIGFRIVTSFIDDVYKTADFIRAIDGCEVVEEKDYIKNVKPNGYRSYHMILKQETPYEDVAGRTPGTYYIEVQLRTIAMDTWASLEHELKYKQEIHDQEILVGELKRCADELASCDLSMQTIRDLIRGN